jgi:Protein of unknown function (DUF4231)
MNGTFEYLERRLEPQRKWHNDKATWNKRRFYAVEVATLLAGAAIPVVNLWLVRDAFWAGVLSAILGGVVVVAASVGKLFKFHENWLQYRTLVEALEREKELYSVGAADYAEADEAGRNRLLVERVENILASTTSQFIETHQSARGVEPSEHDHS